MSTYTPTEFNKNIIKQIREHRFSNSLIESDPEKYDPVLDILETDNKIYVSFTIDALPGGATTYVVDKKRVLWKLRLRMN